MSLAEASYFLAVGAGALAFFFCWLESLTTTRFWSGFYVVLAILSLFGVAAALIVPNWHDSENAGAYIFMVLLIWVVVIGAAKDIFPERREPKRAKSRG